MQRLFELCNAILLLLTEFPGSKGIAAALFGKDVLLGTRVFGGTA
jgi:hypothetical protein